MSEQRPFEVGDEVYEVEYAGIRRVKVVRVTKTLAVVATGRKYRQGDGARVGAAGWDHTRLEHQTEALDDQWDQQRVRVARGELEGAAECGTPSEIRAAFAVWDKLEKEVNGE